MPPRVNIQTTWNQYIAPLTTISLEDAYKEAGSMDSLDKFQVLAKLLEIAKKHSK